MSSIRVQFWPTPLLRNLREFPIYANADTMSSVCSDIGKATGAGARTKKVGPARIFKWGSETILVNRFHYFGASISGFSHLLCNPWEAGPGG